MDVELRRTEESDEGADMVSTIVNMLEIEGREVKGDGPTWWVSYPDIEDQTAAEDALLDELNRLAPGWTKVLVIQTYA